jgi:2-polyprenyl-6-methoxyphenol hydroxylase-like FAD-dependent oxidoreductase
VTVERRTELLGYRDEGDGVIAGVRGPDGREENCEAAYIAGCDGVRSSVRETMGTGFAGGTYRHLFYVADVEASGPAIDGELNADIEEADFLAVFPLAAKGRVRLIGTVRDERADRAETLTFDDVSRRIIENLKVDVKTVNWFSTLSRPPSCNAAFPQRPRLPARRRGARPQPRWRAGHEHRHR